MLILLVAVREAQVKGRLRRQYKITGIRSTTLSGSRQSTVRIGVSYLKRRGCKKIYGPLWFQADRAWDSMIF
jgi:hypothetical protein